MLNDDEESPSAVYYRQIRQLSHRPSIPSPFPRKRQDSSSSSFSSPSSLRFRNERSVFFSEDTKAFSDDDDDDIHNHYDERGDGFSMSSMRRRGMKSSRSFSPTSGRLNLRDSSRFSQPSQGFSFHHCGSHSSSSSSCSEGGFFNSFARESRKEEGKSHSPSTFFPARALSSHGLSRRGRFNTKERSRSFNRFLSEGGISRCYVYDDSHQPSDGGVHTRYPAKTSSYDRPSSPVKAYNITRQQRGFRNVSVCTPQPTAEATGPSDMSRRGEFLPSSDGFASFPLLGLQPQQGELQNIIHPLVQSYPLNENQGSPYSFYQTAPPQSDPFMPSSLPDMAPVVITRRTRAVFPGGGEEGRRGGGWGEDSYAGRREEEDAASAPRILPNVFVGMLTVSLNDDDDDVREGTRR